MLPIASPPSLQSPVPTGPTTTPESRELHLQHSRFQPVSDAEKSEKPRLELVDQDAADRDKRESRQRSERENPLSLYGADGRLVTFGARNSATTTAGTDAAVSRQNNVSTQNGVATQNSASAENTAPTENENTVSTEKTMPTDNRKAEQQLALIQEQVRTLAARDREVRAHEQAHAAAGGPYAGAPRYQYERGPDGVNYAVSGEVPIDTSKASTPEQTLAKAMVIKRAAMAPQEPSSQDRKVAQEAIAMAADARRELAALAALDQPRNPTALADSLTGPEMAKANLPT